MLTNLEMVFDYTMVNIIADITLVHQVRVEHFADSYL